MSGLNYRGRQRLRDHAATERLRALLAAAATGDDGAAGTPDPEHRGLEKQPRERTLPAHELQHEPQRTPDGAPGGGVRGPTPEPARAARDPGGGGLHRQPVRVRHTLAAPAAVVLAVAAAPGAVVVVEVLAAVAAVRRVARTLSSSPTGTLVSSLPRARSPCL